MKLSKLVPVQGGVIKDTTRYSRATQVGDGEIGITWADSDRVRFRNNYPEKIGGWTPYVTSPLIGAIRSMYAWNALDLTERIGVGTTYKFYVMKSQNPTDVTPIRRTQTLGANPIAVSVPVTGTARITVTDTAHGAQVGDFVTLAGASAVGGLTTAQINKEHQIISVTPDTWYVDIAATGSVATGGGGSVTAAYQMNSGLDYVSLGLGWGAGTWGRNGWGDPANTPVASSQIRLWSQDNFGEDLVFNPRYGGIYYYDTSANTRAVTLGSMAGARDVPSVGCFVLCDPLLRQVVVFGCNDVGAASIDPMLIRWSDQENPVDFRQDTATSAGSYRLNLGNEIIAAVYGREEILVFTDKALYAMRPTGTNDVYSFHLLSDSVNLISPNSIVSYNDRVYWMEFSGFQVYDGRVQKIPCPWEYYISSTVDENQYLKVCSGVNYQFNEFWWFYPSKGSSGNDRYICYSFANDAWYGGTMARSAWLSNLDGVRPLGASEDGWIYVHENGRNDSVGFVTYPLNEYAETAPFEISSGDSFSFVNSIVPDFQFDEDTSSPNTITLTLKGYNYMGESATSEPDKYVSVVAPLLFTNKIDVRLRARSVALRVGSGEQDTNWRLGNMRIRIRPDGRK